MKTNMTTLNNTTGTAAGAEEKKEKSRFRLPSLIWLVILILYILAILSYDVSDLAILEGGLEDVAMEKNWIGNIGAHIARAFFYLFGLSMYPICLILVASVIRSLIPFPLKRQGYSGAIISVIAALSILFAMWPDHFLESVETHGLGRAIHPDMCLSGGVFGAVLAAPAVNEYSIQLEPGFLRRHIGETGTLVVSLAFLLPGLFLMFMQDWFPLIMHVRTLRRKQAAQPTTTSRETEITNPVPETVVKTPMEEERTGNVETPPETKPAQPGKAMSFVKKFCDLFVPSEDLPAEQETPEEQEEQSSGSILPPDQPAVPEAEAVPPVIKSAPVIVPPPAEPDEETGAAAVPPPVADADTQPVAPPPDVETRHSVPQANIREFSREQSNYDNKRPASSGAVQRSSFTGIECPGYVLPLVSLMNKQVEVKSEDHAHIEESRDRIQKTLESFNVDGHVSEIIVGPRVTRFEVTLAPGVKVEKVTGIQGNISMDLAAETIRILAPIPGKTAVGIEVPNKVSSVVYIRSLLESNVWKESHAQIPIILGRDIAGEVIVTDLSKAPHLLIAGSTGSGKSVCMNTLIMSLLFRFSPSDLRLIMVDPKVVELEMYRPIPHLITPVVNDPKKVPLALRWGVNEMERRYRVMAKVHAKKLSDFNSRPQDPAPVLDEDGVVIPQHLPLLIIIIDELADIMMTDAKSDVETSICRIAQKGRAAGIHLVIATQTPRKDIITGLIKANLPTKIAFKVSSNMDSRVILDASGAEKLLGMGDMLFKPNGASGMERIQGSMVSDAEIQKVVDFVSGQAEQNFISSVVDENVEVKGMDDEDDDSSSYAESRSSREDGRSRREDDDYDLSSDPEYESPAAKYLQPGDSELIKKALEIIITEQKASTSYLQRRLGIGYNKSAELMDTLEKRGIISAPLPGGQKREILITDGLEENK